MRRNAVLLVLAVISCVALPGCQLLLDLLGGAQFNVGGVGGEVTVRLENQSGLRVAVEAKFTALETEVRNTKRILAASGPESESTILPTFVERLNIVARVDPTADLGTFAGIVTHGQVLASGEFQWGVDFRNGDTFVFIVPAPFVPPTEIIDCDGDGLSDSDTIAACDGDPSCMDCNNNTIPDSCDIGNEVPAIVVSPPTLGFGAEPRGTSLSTSPLGEGLSAEDLVNLLVGPGVTVSNVQYTGNLLAAGSFEGGQGSIGIGDGIVLSSGLVSNLPGPNTVDNRTYNFEEPGDQDLDALLSDAKQSTNDAAVLEFDFICEQNNVISFRYVFASEEYNEFIQSSYNDVFAFFLNGENIAIVPGTESTQVAIQTINCGPTPGISDGPNCDLFRNNDLYTGQGLDTEMDGLTVVLSATGQTVPGVNHIKIAIADTSDFDLDSAVFLQGVSFVCQPPRGACCIPGALCQTVTAEECANLPGCYHGDGTDCATATCTDGISLDCDTDGKPDECVPTSQPTSKPSEP